MWITLQNAILTKDNLVKGSGKVMTLAPLALRKNQSHLFFECPVIKYVWSTLAFIFGISVRPSSFKQ
jgi:hypothetical protein